MIRPEDVADLQPGDVVELRGYPSLKDAVITGPLWDDGETQKLCVGPFVIRHRDGTAPTQYEDDPNFDLTVVSRAPRPLYVNHPRTEPVPGDVVRDADSDHALALFIFAPEEEGEPWWIDTAGDWISPAEMREKRLTLLVDGSTGEVVQ